MSAVPSMVAPRSIMTSSTSPRTRSTSARPTIHGQVRYLRRVRDRGPTLTFTDAGVPNSWVRCGGLPAVGSSATVGSSWWTGGVGRCPAATSARTARPGTGGRATRSVGSTSGAPSRGAAGSGSVMAVPPWTSAGTAPCSAASVARACPARRRVTPAREVTSATGARSAGGEPLGEDRPDLDVPRQERALVQPLAPQPAGHLVVALAGVAGAAGRGDVVEGVAPAPGDGQHAVALQRRAGRAAVRAATPRRLQRRPLPGAEVVLDPLHPALALARVPRTRGPARHGPERRAAESVGEVDTRLVERVHPHGRAGDLDLGGRERAAVGPDAVPAGHQGPQERVVSRPPQLTGDVAGPRA